MTSRIQQALKQRRSFGSLEEEVFVGLHLVADRIGAPWTRVLKERADLTPVQYNVLRILRGAGSGGLRSRDIGERLITRSPDITRILDRMETRGLVRRAPDPDDRRAVRIVATQAGLDRIEPLDRDSAELSSGLHALGEARLLELRELLDSVLGALAQGA